jgi:cysteine desulfuration protein SufE
MNYPDRLEELLELFSMYTSEKERIDMLVDFADRFREVPPDIAQKPYPEKNKVPFCESGAYVFKVKHPDETVKLYFAVENPQGVSAKALSAILEKTLSGEKEEVLKNIPEDLVYKLFGQSLSMGKNMGLTGIIQMIKRSDEFK